MPSCSTPVIAPGDFLFYDGSGLSSQDLITPRAATQLLVFAATQPWFQAYKASLPVAGTDGTLIHRFTDASPAGNLQGRVLAKTGTLGETRALSGYLTAASGQTLAFSILVDTHTPRRPRRPPPHRQNPRAGSRRQLTAPTGCPMITVAASEDYRGMCLFNSL